jgi:transposase
MQTVTTVGLDIAKSVFQVHGVDAEGNVLIRRQLKRRYVLTFFEKLPPCLVIVPPGRTAVVVAEPFGTRSKTCPPGICRGRNPCWFSFFSAVVPMSGPRPSTRS